MCRKTYALDNSRIGGYGRPDWSLVPDEEDEGGGTMMVEAKVSVPNGGTVNLRKTPNGTVLAKIKNETALQIVEDYNDEWAKVSVGGKSGYIMKKYLETASCDEVTLTLDRA